MITRAVRMVNDNEPLSRITKYTRLLEEKILKPIWNKFGGFMDIEKAINDYMEQIKDALTGLDVEYAKQIYDCFSYSPRLGGKRLRPLLLLHTCEALSGDIKSAMPFAAAIELIHTYSLIHDDLPCMDNDDLRRGKPTNHIVFGYPMALLAGDFLLNYSFEIMLSAIEENEADISSKIKATRAIALAAGVNGMITGQAVDILSTNKTINSDTLLYLHSHKTGALLKACLVAGAHLAKADDETLRKLAEAGDYIGLLFQITDDVLDIYSTSEKTGKGINRDINCNKNTYVSMFGIDKCIEDIKDLSQKALSVLDELGLKNTNLYELVVRRFSFEPIRGIV